MNLKVIICEFHHLHLCGCIQIAGISWELSWQMQLINKFCDVILVDVKMLSFHHLYPFLNHQCLYQKQGK